MLHIFEREMGERKMKWNKRVLAGITVICMLLSLQPVTVQAAGQQVKERTTTLDLTIS